MTAIGVSFVARGRIAWILALVFGLVLLVIGLAVQQTFLAIVGGAFALFGLIFLILSLATGGRSD